MRTLIGLPRRNNFYFNGILSLSAANFVIGLSASGAISSITFNRNTRKRNHINANFVAKILHDAILWSSIVVFIREKRITSKLKSLDRIIKRGTISILLIFCLFQVRILRQRIQGKLIFAGSS